MKKYIKASFALLLTVGSLSSCIKETPTVEAGNTPAVVELGDLDNNTNGVSEYASVDYKYNLYRKSFDIKTTPTTFSIPIKYSGGLPAPEDITVTLALNNDIITGYNTYHGYASQSNASFVLPLPAANYSVPSYTVVIPKGQTYGMFNVTFNTNLFTFSNQFALGFSIKSASNSASVSGNFGTCLYIFQAKNAYDADYATTGYFFHPSSPRALKATKHISTVGLTASSAPLADLGGSNYYFGFTIDANNALTAWTPLGATPTGTASGFMTVDNAAPFPTTADQRPGTNGWLQSTYNNTYAPASKTFMMHYGYNGSPNAYTRQAYEKWVAQ